MRQAGNSSQKGLSRRQALAAGLCLCCAPLVARAGSFDIEEAGPGVFMRRGADEDANASNLDAIANIGFIVGEDAVLVTDSGGSLADGRWLRQAIKEKTQKPIKYVVLSHVHPDHSFGASAFLEDRPEFIGHAKLRAALEARGEYYRQRLVEAIGESNAGPVVMPTRVVAGGDQVNLGGRTVTFKAHGPAHTTTDISMRDSASGLLFPADLLFVDRVPSLDGSLIGWLKELDALKAEGISHAVPGHGPLVSAFAQSTALLERYLIALRDGVRQEIKNNGSIEHAMLTVGQSEKDNWKLFGSYNQRNVIEAYKELEWE